MTNSKKIAVIGCGNWGSCIAKIVASNVAHNNEFNHEVEMWVFETTVKGKKLTDIINETHQNSVFLPGIPLPHNLVAKSDLLPIVQKADILLFILPHVYMADTLRLLKGHIKPGAYAVSFVKALLVQPNGSLSLVSDLIRSELGIPCAVVMGANQAREVSKEHFSEATIGCKDRTLGVEIKQFLQTDYFRLVVCADEVGVELCSCLKNIVAVAAGIVDGLESGDNTKAAVIRLGYVEIMNFMKDFYGDRGVQQSTALQSCGVAELFMCIAYDRQLAMSQVQCFGVRSILLGQRLATTNDSLDAIERAIFRGEPAPGAQVVREISNFIRSQKMEARYPLLTAVHKIIERQLEPKLLYDQLTNHPAHQ